MRRGVLLAVLVTAFLAGCGGSEGSAGTENAGAAGPKDSVAAAPTDAAGTAAPGCRVTRPNGRTAPGESLSQSFYGMTGLWTLLPVDDVLRITSVTPVPPGATGGTVHSDGSLSTKFPWWGSRSASARLRIRAKRLDGGARQLRVTAGPGSSARSPHFWPTRLRFATSGCWQVDARSGRAHLTFILSVQAARD